jgi:ethanolamine utilization protein EutQ (cupin superfamily)
MEFHHVAAAAIATEPLEVGDDSKLSLVDIIDRTQGAPFCAGVCEVFPGAPVDFDYDDDAAVCLMLEGEITLTENGSTRRFDPGDVVYIPQKKGLVVFWSTTSYGRFFYVTYPHWR